MPNINAVTMIKRDITVVYGLLTDMVKFPGFMRDAKQVTVEQRGDKKIITRWNVDIDGTPVEWVQEDILDPSLRSLKFKMLEGDFEVYEGEWTLSKSGDSTRLVLKAHIEWGVPNFEKFIGHILEEKACRGLRSMVWLIRCEAHRKK